MAGAWAAEGIDVHKVYQSGTVQVHALKGINLRIHLGEIVAVMGPSGCGKTTLLNCFSGLDEVTQGKVLIDGKVLSELSDAQRTAYRARRMGFVFQSYNLLPVLTALENTGLPLLVAGTSGPEAERKGKAILERVGLGDWAGHRPMELSAGQQQRVAIARALVNDPAIVWADEPTGNLDSETSSQIMDLIVELNHQLGTTFVIVTHDQEVAGRGGRVIKMRSGEIVEDRGASG